MYPFTNYNYNNYTNKNNQIDTNKKYIQNSIELGLNLMRDQDLSEERLGIWLSYTEEILKLCFQNTSSNVYIRFLEIKLIVQLNSSLQPFQKLGAYLQFLIEVMKIL